MNDSSISSDLNGLINEQEFIKIYDKLGFKDQQKNNVKTIFIKSDHSQNNFISKQKIQLSSVTSDLHSLINQEQFDQIYDGLGFNHRQKDNIRKVFIDYKKESPTMNSTLNQHRSSNKVNQLPNKYLDKYLNWKDSQPLSKVLPKLNQNVFIKTQSHKFNQQQLMNELKVKELELKTNIISEYSYRNKQKNETNNIQHNGNQNKQVQKQLKKQFSISKIQSINIDRSTNKKEYETMTCDIQQELKKIKQQQQKLKRNYQQLIRYPPKLAQKSDKKQISIMQQKQKQTISSIKVQQKQPPLFKINPNDLFVQKQIKQIKNQQKEETQKDKNKFPQIKKEDLQRFLKNTLENAGQKTIKQLSQDHKRKVFDFLYNK